MAGFGSISLAQTVVGTLLDQRSVVLYKQPTEDKALFSNEYLNKAVSDLWAGTLQYQELFSGLAEYAPEVITRAANISGANPYGITYMSARVNVETDLCDHPVETGHVVTDARIIQPKTAQVEVAMPTFFAQRIYKSLNEMVESIDKKIILQTKYGVYKNLVLQGFSYSLENKTVDRTLFALTLREIVEVAPYGEFSFKAAEKLKDKSDSDTISNGTQVAGV